MLVLLTLVLGLCYPLGKKGELTMNWYFRSSLAGVAAFFTLAFLLPYLQDIPSYIGAAAAGLVVMALLRNKLVAKIFLMGLLSILVFLIGSGFFAFL